MTTPSLSLRLDEAAELGELLEFVGAWLGKAPPAVRTSLCAFVGVPGYDLSDLRADCAKFAFLLGVASTPFVSEIEGS
jgi:hypothetical protein